MARALITGGAGFIGSHLAEKLLDRGDEVYIIDDLSTGSINNIAHLKANPKFHYVIDIMSHEPVLAELVDLSDTVYHLAAAVGVFLVVESPVYTIENTVRGTELVLKWANKKKKKVLITSTSEVYGKSTRIPFNEADDLVIGPSSMGRWSYACSKLLDEFLALAHHREHNLPVVVARLFNTVGPRQSGRYGMVIPRFVSQALNGQPLTVFGTGQQSRCFTYVGDTVNALVGLMDHPETAGQLYNVGNPEEITIETLARRIITRTNSKSEIRYVPYSEAYSEGFEDMSRRVPDIAKVQQAIGYQPTVGLDEILDRVIAFIRQEQLTGTHP
ncbi:MAG: NAD-dependent epimerase/dehydratase [Chloroflexi bacterium]|nr:NAD-dependent epimerase/dehydratase [Chloroflexota bacterium]